jgi:hypothetical protein
MKTLSIPQVGSKVRVTTRYKDIYIYAKNPYRDQVYEGEVVNPDKWMDTDSFKVFTGNPELPYSIISASNVHDVKYITGGSGRAVKSDIKTFTVKGSKGEVYTVTQTGTRWNCSCVGFQFRRQCKHIKEKQNA